MAVARLHAVDWVLFAAMLLVSVGIGIYYACVGGKQKTTVEFLLADRNLGVIPVSVSILLSFMSAILILGTPAEMYTEGTEFYMQIFAGLGVIIGAQLFVPLLFPLNITSSFEYLERRFQSRAAKLTGTCIMIIQQVIYMGIASFAPSTALEAVTGFPTWATIITVGLVSTFYTSLGGMKAVVWTDVFQSVVMLGGLLAIVIQGSITVGGMEEVWKINEDWDRIDFFDFNPDPTVRHTFWTLVIGGIIGFLSMYGVNQASVQRYCALPTLRKAKISVMLTCLGIFILMTVVCLTGIVVFAYYTKKGCDPLSDDSVSNSNQLVPYFVMDVLNYPGIPGLFISSLFSGALSTMSSSLNALAAVTWEDFLKPVLHDRLTERQRTLVTKFLVVIFGGAGIGTAFIAMNLGGTVLQAALSFNGAANGPVLGMFALGAFFPWANWIGVVVGGIIGLCFPMWILIGAYTVVGTPTGRPTPTWNCTFPNTTDSMTTMMTIGTTDTSSQEFSGISSLYTVSYLWYPAIGASTVIVVGLIVSLLTGMNHIGEVDTRYLSPFFDRLFCCLPGPISRVLRCYQVFDDPDDIRSMEKDEEFIIAPSSKTVTTSSSEKVVLNGKQNLTSYGTPDKHNRGGKDGFINPAADIFFDEKQQNRTKF